MTISLILYIPELPVWDRPTPHKKISLIITADLSRENGHPKNFAIGWAGAGPRVGDEGSSER
jgi:hypothetical protein